MWHLREEHTGMFRIGFFPWVCEMKISPAISVNKKYDSHQQFLASKCEWGLPKLWPRGCCHSPWWLLRSWEKQEAAICCSLRWTKKQGWPQIAELPYGRNESSESRGLHLPRNRTLNSLTWYLIFDIQTAFPFVANLYIGWLPLLPPWSTFLRATEMLSPGPRVLNIPTK